MDRTATLTVIRGNGECRAYYDGIVSDEIKKMNERYAAKERMLNRQISAKQEELRQVQSRRNQLLSERMARLEMMEPDEESRAKMWFLSVWALIWLIGEKLGLWEYVEYDC